MTPALATDRPPARWFLQNLVRVHVTGEDSDGRLGVVEITGRPGDMPPLHVHHEEDEVFFVLEGEVTLFIAGQDPVRLGPGGSAYAPRGLAHVYEVTSPEPARWLGLSSPSGFAHFVMELSEPAPVDDLPGDVDIDPAHVADVAGRYGIEILGPPGARP
jgi:quercetin dioxygenase-like cupin family protein